MYYRYLSFFLLNFFFRWQNNKISFLSPCLYFGHDQIPLSNEKSSGGIIKCQDLQERYPNSRGDANIIYLISSALPQFPQYMIRFAKKRGVKLVWNQNGVAYPAWHGSGWEKTNKPMASSLHKADFVIYQSQFCRLGSDRFLGKYQGQSIILYNPVDTSVFRPAEAKPSGWKVLLAGTHNERYRIRIALETFRQILFHHPEAELIIAGPLRWKKDSAEARADAESLCRLLSLDGKVQFTGPYSQKEAVSMFQSAHILLHTQYNDACPRLVVEAMSCGLPVVYSASGGTPELVGEEAGIGIPAPLDWEKVHPPSPAALASAVLDVYKNYNHYAEAARKQAVDNFDLAPWLDRHEQIFKEVLS